MFHTASGLWRTTATVGTNLPEVAASALVDNGSLLVAVSPSGGFEVSDATDGRLLISRSTARRRQQGQVHGDSPGRRDLFLYLDTGNDLVQVTTFIQIRNGAAAITGQLCRLYRAPGCPGP